MTFCNYIREIAGRSDVIWRWNLRGTGSVSGLSDWAERAQARPLISVSLKCANCANYLKAEVPFSTFGKKTNIDLYSRSIHSSYSSLPLSVSCIVAPLLPIHYKGKLPPIFKESLFFFLSSDHSAAQPCLTLRSIINGSHYSLQGARLLLLIESDFTNGRQ